MILMIDNYDSFTYNIVHDIEKNGYDIEVLRNDFDIEKIDFRKYDAIILSPGPSTPDNAGITLEVIKKNLNKPMLGICLGMQAMIQAFGGKIVQAGQIIHGKSDYISHTGENIFKDIPQRFKAVRYHSLCGEKETFPDVLEVEAHSSDGIIQGISHKEYKIYGVQFHPESYETEYGNRIFENFISMAGIKK